MARDAGAVSATESLPLAFGLRPICRQDFMSIVHPSIDAEPAAEMGLLSSDPGSPPATTSELRGAGIAFVAVVMVAFEGTWLRLLQRDGVPLETYQFWICSGKGLVQLAFVVPNTYRARQQHHCRQKLELNHQRQGPRLP